MIIPNIISVTLQQNKMLLAKTLFVTLGMTIAAFAADPFIGTWKVNVEKSKNLIRKTAATNHADSRGYIQTDIGSNRIALPEPMLLRFDGKEYTPPGQGIASACGRREVQCETDRHQYD